MLTIKRRDKGGEKIRIIDQERIMDHSWGRRLMMQFMMMMNVERYGRCVVIIQFRILQKENNVLEGYTIVSHMA